MPLLRAGSQILRRGGAQPWETGGGTIPLANVIYAAKLPALRTQVTTGLPLSSAWTVAFRTVLASIPYDLLRFAFDSATGRVSALTNNNSVNGFTSSPGVTNNIGWFATGDHTYMLVGSGSSMQAYRDNVAIGDAVSAATDIGGVTRWGSRYAESSGVWYDWSSTFPAVELCNIALDATQRAGLHASMMALPAS